MHQLNGPTSTHVYTHPLQLSRCGYTSVERAYTLEYVVRVTKVGNAFTQVSGVHKSMVYVYSRVGDACTQEYGVRVHKGRKCVCVHKGRYGCVCAVCKRLVAVLCILTNELE